MWIGAVDVGAIKIEVETTTSHDQVPVHQECPADAHREYVLALDSVSERHRPLISNATPVSTRLGFPPTVTASWVE